MRRLLPQIFQASCLIFSALFTSFPVSAQIAADGTTSTTVTSDGNNFTINTGDRAGGNLFHSFSDFSVPTGGSASFNNTPDIDNILNRVTGGSISNIDGLIRANGSANVFLLNPAGIIFGNNARLDIGGSFLGSTADSILFPDDVAFSASNIQPPVLTINAPIGLSFRDTVGDIVNQSIVNGGADLEVSVGENITLVGGNVNLDNGRIFAPGGRVELGGLSTAGEMGINADGSLSFPDNVARADVTLTNGAEVDVRTGGGGQIIVNARNIELSSGESGASGLFAGIAEDSSLNAAQAGYITLNATDTITVNQGSGIFNQVGANAIGNAGDINIITTDLSLTAGSVVSASTFGEGDGGAITIEASGTISVDGQGVEGFSNGIFSRAEGSGEGNGSEIDITTTNLSLRRGGRIDTSAFGQGNAGVITIEASGTISAEGVTPDRVPSGIFSGVALFGTGNGGEIDITTPNLSLIEGGRVDVSTFGEGNAGAVTINALGTISVDVGSGIFSQVNSNAVGDGGDIKITTTDLSLTAGSVVDTRVFGRGEGGAITIEASGTISVDGQGVEGFTTGIFAALADDDAIGSGGDIKITTTDLSLKQGGRVGASTLGRGNGGAITINALGTISADGTTPGGIPSGIFSQVNSNAVGDGGDINITTTNLSLTEGTPIDARVFGEGDGGDIIIEASGTISADGQGAEGFSTGIFAALASSNAVGSGGDIKITTTDLSLKQGGRVGASTEGQGNGGDITVEASGTISAEGTTPGLMFGRISSGIFSEVFPDAEGNAGDINITMNPDLSLTNEAEISVESLGQGNAGSLFIQANSIDLENGASLEASTPLGTGGNITLQVADNLTLRDNSTISAEALGNANGGTVTIDAEFIIASLNQNNDIIASAELGEGGNININSQGVFGLEERSSTPDNKTNDIDASSEFGLDGSVLINTPDVSEIEDEIQAPEVIEPETLSAQACSGGESGVSSFEITGKGGIAPIPIDPLTADAIIINGKYITTNTKTDAELREEPKNQSHSNLGLNEIDAGEVEETEAKKRQFVTIIEREQPFKLDEIVPARGMIIKENGDVILTAYPTPNSAARTPIKSANCRG